MILKEAEVCAEETKEVEEEKTKKVDEVDAESRLITYKSDFEERMSAPKDDVCREENSTEKVIIYPSVEGPTLGFVPSSSQFLGALVFQMTNLNLFPWLITYKSDSEERMSAPKDDVYREENPTEKVIIYPAVEGPTLGFMPSSSQFLGALVFQIMNLNLFPWL